MTDLLFTAWGLDPAAAERATLRRLLALAVAAVRCDEGSLLLRDPAQGDLVFAMTIGSDLAERTLTGQRVPIGQGVTGLAAHTRQVQSGSPTYDTVQPARHPAAAAAERPRLVIAAPMLIGDLLLGVITAVSFDWTAAMQGGQRDRERLLGLVAIIAGEHLDLARRVRTGAPGPGADHALAAIGADLNDILARRPDALAQVRTVITAMRDLV
jgi:hypothetical protein